MMDVDTNRLEFPTSDPFFSSILSRYSALVPVKNISIPSSIPFNVAHEFFLRGILLNRHLEQYSPSESYQQSFWKWAVVQLENITRSDENDEVDERIYAHYLSLRCENRCAAHILSVADYDCSLLRVIASSSSGTPPDSFITHYWKFPNTQDHPTEKNFYEKITLLESRTTIGAGTTGLRTWRASLVLAQYLIQHPHLVDTSNVLELGSGTGFIGILVANLQLRTAHPFDRKMPSVCMTDMNLTVLSRCQNNIKLPCNKSSFHPNLRYKSLDWRDSLSDPDGLKSFFDEAKVDILLGADIGLIFLQVFDPTFISPLVKTISLAFSCEQTRLAFIALTVRNEDTLTHFLREIGEVLRIEEVPYHTVGNPFLQVPDQVDCELEVKIYKVTRGILP